MSGAGNAMANATAPLLGIDWGSSNRRAYLLDARGELMGQHNDDAGILHVDGNFEHSLKRLLNTLELRDADIIMSGMVGSRNGWREAPYLPVEQLVSRLHDALTEIETSLPGVRCRVVPGRTTRTTRAGWRGTSGSLCTRSRSRPTWWTCCREWSTCSTSR